MNNTQIEKTLHAKLDNLTIDELSDLLNRVDNTRAKTDPEAEILHFNEINEVHDYWSIKEHTKHLMDKDYNITAYAEALASDANWYTDDCCGDPQPIEDTADMLEICFQYWSDIDKRALLSFINKSGIQPPKED